MNLPRVLLAAAIPLLPSCAQSELPQEFAQRCVAHQLGTAPASTGYPLSLLARALMHKPGNQLVWKSRGSGRHLLTVSSDDPHTGAVNQISFEVIDLDQPSVGSPSCGPETVLVSSVGTPQGSVNGYAAQDLVVGMLIEAGPALGVPNK